MSPCYTAQLDRAYDVGPGRVIISAVMNYLIEMTAAELKTDPVTEYAGRQG